MAMATRRVMLVAMRHSVAAGTAMERPTWAAGRRCRKYATGRQPSATSQFYRTFSRPIAKALLLAVFTYQLVYWTWAKLEADEARAETQATIADLEAQVSTQGKAGRSEAVKSRGLK